MQTENSTLAPKRICFSHGEVPALQQSRANRVLFVKCMLLVYKYQKTETDYADFVQTQMHFSPKDLGTPHHAKTLHALFMRSEGLKNDYNELITLHDELKKRNIPIDEVGRYAIDSLRIAQKEAALQWTRESGAPYYENDRDYERMVEAKYGEEGKKLLAALDHREQLQEDMRGFVRRALKDGFVFYYAHHAQAMREQGLLPEDAEVYLSDDPAAYY